MLKVNHRHLPFEVFYFYLMRESNLFSSSINKTDPWENMAFSFRNRITTQYKTSILSYRVVKTRQNCLLTDERAEFDVNTRHFNQYAFHIYFRYFPDFPTKGTYRSLRNYKLNK